MSKILFKLIQDTSLQSDRIREPLIFNTIYNVSTVTPLVSCIAGKLAAIEGTAAEMYEKLKKQNCDTAEQGQGKVEKNSDTEQR